MLNKRKEICYRCGGKAISREHIPPLCLFPEQKDQPDTNFRKNLITVPSCDEHNAKKSKDDEFLLLTLPSIVGNNAVGYIHTKTKLLRAYQRLPKEFFEKAIARNAKDYFFKVDERATLFFSVANPDYKRFVRCFENIAAGLYFHEFKAVFSGRIVMHFGFVNYEKKDHNTFVSFLRNKFIQETNGSELKGNNREVFAYGFSPIEENSIKCLKLLFYESADVYLAFIPDGIPQPSNIATELINKGVQTTITLGEKEFRFNFPSQ